MKQPAYLGSQVMAPAAIREMILAAIREVPETVQGMILVMTQEMARVEIRATALVANLVAILPVVETMAVNQEIRLGASPMCRSA